MPGLEGGTHLPLPYPPPLPRGPLSLVPLSLTRQGVEDSQNVGPLFPLITPSPVAAASPIASAFPVITPSPAATSPVGTPGSGQVLPGQDEGLTLSEPLAGSRPAGLVLIVLGVAGAAGWLLLSRGRKRRALFAPSSVPATSPGVGRGITGVSPAATPVPGRIPSGARGWGLAPGEKLAGSRQARVVLTVLAVSGAAGWLLLGRARKRRVP